MEAWMEACVALDRAEGLAEHDEYIQIVKRLWELLDMEWSVTVFDRKLDAGCPANYSAWHAIPKD